MTTGKIQFIATEDSRKRAEQIMAEMAADPTYRKSVPTKEFCIAELRLDTYSVDQMLRDMQCQINGSIAELLAEIKGDEKVQSVQVLWKNIPDREKNPDGSVGYWMVLVAKRKVNEPSQETVRTIKG